ncbi:hypothetical protein BKA62DRAFT_85818 [Auriculariales sp. MPI-PUGE-AT-0066]|nr:hypothetical protein BKA62DRAFT_85818 [Auriculariales sp. MPI-PUGE-AT-0066]
MSFFAHGLLLFLCITSSFATGRLVTVPFDDSRIVYDTGLWSFEAMSSPPAEAQGLDFLCSRLFGSISQKTLGRATTAAVSAGFTFSFNGTSASILSSAGPAVAPFVVTQDDGNTPVPSDATTLVPVNKQPSSVCKNTFSVVGLNSNGTQHSLRVVVVAAGDVLHGAPAAELHPVINIFAIMYEDGSDDTSQTSTSALQTSASPTSTSPAATGIPPTTTASSRIGPTVALALCVSIVALVLVITPLLFYLRRRGLICYGGGRLARPIMPREGDKRCDVLTECAPSIAPSAPTGWSHPTFLRGLTGTIKMRADGLRLWSDDLTASSRRTGSSRSLSGFTLLRPPVSTKDATQSSLSYASSTTSY